MVEDYVHSLSSSCCLPFICSYEVVFLWCFFSHLNLFSFEVLICLNSKFCYISGGCAIFFDQFTNYFRQFMILFSLSLFDQICLTPNMGYEGLSFTIFLVVLNFPKFQVLLIFWEGEQWFKNICYQLFQANWVNFYYLTNLLLV